MSSRAGALSVNDFECCVDVVIHSESNTCGHADRVSRQAVASTSELGEEISVVMVLLLMKVNQLKRVASVNNKSLKIIHTI